MNRLLDIIRKRFAPQNPSTAPEIFPQQITIHEMSNTELRFNVYSRVERKRVAGYGHEKAVLEQFLAALRPKDVVYDIGASVGLYTVTAAARIPQGKLYSFEPDPDTRNRLLENISLNKLNNIEVIDWAVSNTEGETILYSDGAAGFAPSMVLQDRPRAPKGEVQIETRRLDFALEQGQLLPPDILKIDIEGAEGLCIEGSQKLLSGIFGKKPRMILLEIHPQFMAPFNITPETLKKMMSQMNYQPTWSDTRDQQELICYVDLGQP